MYPLKVVCEVSEKAIKLDNHSKARGKNKDVFRHTSNKDSNIHKSSLKKKKKQKNSALAIRKVKLESQFV